MKAAVQAGIRRAVIAAAAFAAFQLAGHLTGQLAAFADVAGFNAAIKKGDYATAAIQAEDAWKTWNRTDPDTAIVANEFGFAALAAGRYDFAKEMGKFLIDNGATLPTPDPQPQVARVLYATADYRIGKSPEQLAALRAALEARTAAPGAEMTSVMGWDLLYVAVWNTGDWEAASRDAANAAQFFSRQPGRLLGLQRQAEVYSAAAKFISGRERITKGRNDYYTAMADLHDRIVADINAATPAKRAELWAHKWRAEAWSLTILAFLNSTYAQIGSNINSDVDQRRLARPDFAPVLETGPDVGLPLCEGNFSGKNIYYPSSKEFQGLVGSVIARMETDATGKVTAVKVVAAVPSEGNGFAATVERALSTWTFKPAKGSDLSRCRVASKNHIYRVRFMVG